MSKEAPTQESAPRKLSEIELEDNFLVKSDNNK